MKLLWIALVLLVLQTFSACNTVAGVGRDVQKAGQALEKVAD
jgi:predicted small secreted protein